MTWDRRRIFKTIAATTIWLLFALLFIPFYAELLMAAVFAFAIDPALGRFLKKRKFKWRPSVAIILSGMFVALAVPITVVFYKLYAYVMDISKTGLQNTPVFQKLMSLKDRLSGMANSLLEKYGYGQDMDFSALGGEYLGRGANWTMGFLTSVLYQVPSILLSVFVFCAALYFFLAEAGPLKVVFQRQRVLSPTESSRFIAILQRSCFNTVVSSMIIAAIQASIVSVGAAILGSGDFTVVWVVTFFCSFVPVIGAGPVALALGLGDLIMGEVGTAIGFLVVAVVAGTMDNLVRPYLIASGDEDLHPVVSLLAIIGALIIFGMPGLFLGPVIAAWRLRSSPFS